MLCTAAKSVPRLLSNDQKEDHFDIWSERKEQTENDELETMSNQC
jgi:hypothetical protein